MKKINLKKTGYKIAWIIDENFKNRESASIQLGVSRSAIYLWTSGRKEISVTNLMNLCEATGCDVNDILVLEEV